MTQQLLIENIGNQKGYQNNVQGDNQQGFILADQITFSKPFQGFSKRKGQKLCLESSDQNRRAFQEVETGVLTLRESDVLGYQEEGFAVSLFCLNGSSVVSFSDPGFSIQNQIRFSFEDLVWDEVLPFFSQGFPDKSIGAFAGWFVPFSSFSTIAVEQDSVDSDLLRLSTSINLPVGSSSILLTLSTGLVTSPALALYDIISLNDTFTEIYPTGSPAPSWTSTGDTGFVNFDLQGYWAISLSTSAESTETLGSSYSKIYFDVPGQVPSNFDLTDVKKVILDETGDETFFNSNLGQTYFSDESPTSPRVSYYGVPKAIDCVPFQINSASPDVTTRQSRLGPLFDQFQITTPRETLYSYRAVFRKVIQNQIFIGEPSDPFFGFISVNETNLLVNLFLVPNFNTIYFTVFSFFTRDVWVYFVGATTNPVIPDGSIFKARYDSVLGGHVIDSSELNRVLNVDAMVSVTSANLTLGTRSPITVTIPHEIFEEINQRPSTDSVEYFVDIYRTLGQDFDTGTNRYPSPNLSEFFLVKSQRFDEGISRDQLKVAPLLLVFDDDIPDYELEFQLPLYTNTNEEGPLKSNNLAPIYGAQIRKNEVSYLANLTKKKTFVSEALFQDDFAPANLVDPIFVPNQSEFSNSLNLTLNLNDVGTGEANRFTSSIQFENTDTQRVFCSTLPGIPSELIQSNLYSLLIREDQPQRVFLVTYDGVRNFNTFWVRSLNGDLNPSGATGSTGSILIPILVLDSGAYRLPSFLASFNPVGSSFFQLFYIQNLNYVYHLIYRLLNVTHSGLETYLTSEPAGTFEANSFSKVFFQNTTFPSGILSAQILVENKDFLTSPSDFPDWQYTTGGTDVLGKENFPNQLAYSKPLELTAYPPLNFLTVGTVRNQIHSLFKVRDSILICSSEGFYRLTGDVETDYVITNITEEFQSLSPLLNQELNETVFCLSNRGFLAVNESNAQRIDWDIQNLVFPLLSLDLDWESQNFLSFFSFLKEREEEVIWVFPSLNENRVLSSTSEIGLVYHTLTQNWSTLNLQQNSPELIPSAASANWNSSSTNPTELNQFRNQLDRSDFALKEILSQLRQELKVNFELAASSSVVNLSFSFDHELIPSDLITVETVHVNSFVGSGLTESDFQGVFTIRVLDSKNISFNLAVSSLILLNGQITLKLGARGLRGSLALVSGSALATLTLSRLSDLVGWNVGDLIYVQKPYLSSLSSALSQDSDLTGTRELLSVANPFTFNLSSPALANVTVDVEFSKETRQPLIQSFQADSNTFLEEDFAFLEKPGHVFYPFSFEKIQSDNLLQGFLERPFDQQFQVKRPSIVYTGVRSTILTSRLTGGNPATLKNFEEVLVMPQNQWSFTKCQVAFQSDSYFGTELALFLAQTDLLDPISPGFAESFWSSFYNQWSDPTSIQGLFDLYQISPAQIIRLNVPLEVAQGIWMGLLLIHERPFETFALGSLSATGTTLTTTGV